MANLLNNLVLSLKMKNDCNYINDLFWLLHGSQLRAINKRKLASKQLNLQIREIWATIIQNWERRRNTWKWSASTVLLSPKMLIIMNHLPCAWCQKTEWCAHEWPNRRTQNSSKMRVKPLLLMKTKDDGVFWCSVSCMQSNFDVGKSIQNTFR